MFMMMKMKGGFLSHFVKQVRMVRLFLLIGNNPQ